MKYFLRVFLLLLLIGSVAYNRAISEGAANIVDEFRDAFALPFLLVRNIFAASDLASDLAALALENQSLQAEIFRIKSGMPPDKDGNLLMAKVFAGYPFNNKNSFTVARGRSDGLRLGAAVLAVPGIFAGQISKIGEGWSEVSTVFDNSKNTPVRVGERGTAGLLRGGAGLTVSMLDKTKAVKAGDIVYLADKNLPYGLKIGEVRAVRDAGGSVFNEAELLLPYSLGDLEEVFIYVD